MPTEVTVIYEDEVVLRTIFHTDDQDLVRKWAGLRYGTKFERREHDVAEVSRSVRIDIKDAGNICPPDPISEFDELRRLRLHQVEIQEEKRRVEKQRMLGVRILKMKEELDRKEKALKQAQAAFDRKSQKIEEIEQLNPHIGSSSVE